MTERAALCGPHQTIKSWAKPGRHGQRLSPVGLHRCGSKAVERYTNMEIRDDFALRNIAFRQKAYKAYKDLNVVE